MKETRKQMLEILPDAGRVDRYLHYINAWADTFEINTPLRMAHFLAQVLHETAGFKFMKEQGKISYFSKYDKGRLAKMLGNTRRVMAGNIGVAAFLCLPVEPTTRATKTQSIARATSWISQNCWKGRMVP